MRRVVLLVTVLFVFVAVHSAGDDLCGSRPVECVLTGGPGVGKTTLIKELRARGVPCADEAATLVYSRPESKRPSEGLTPTQVGAFQQLITIEQCKLEKDVLTSFGGNDTPEFIFYDRGHVDQVAYSIAGKTTPPQISQEYARERRYDLIFMLEPLEEYDQESNSVRNEDKEESKRLHKLLHAQYLLFGYGGSIISVPNFSVKERADFVLREASLFRKLLPKGGYRKAQGQGLCD